MKLKNILIVVKDIENQNNFTMTYLVWTWYWIITATLF